MPHFHGTKMELEQVLQVLLPSRYENTLMIVDVLAQRQKNRQEHQTIRKPQKIQHN